MCVCVFFLNLGISILCAISLIHTIRGLIKSLTLYLSTHISITVPHHVDILMCLLQIAYQLPNNSFALKKITK